MSDVLQVTGLRKTYGSTVAVDRVSFDVQWTSRGGAVKTNHWA